MLERVRSRRAGHTNSSMVARSRLLSALKLAYYRLFATAYTASLRCADVIWVNSSWTRAHVEALVNGASDSKGGRRPKRIRLLYPPCDTTHLAQFPLETRYRIPPSQESIRILSLAQFRPEKEHPTQLRAFAQLLLSPPSSQSGVTAAAKIPRDKLRLVLAGSVRGPVDADRVEALRRLATELGIAEQVDFVVNESYDVICQLMEKATIGLHTMVDEHFGITLVEFQVRTGFSLHHRYRRGVDESGHAGYSGCRPHHSCTCFGRAIERHHRPVRQLRRLDGLSRRPRNPPFTTSFPSLSRCGGGGGSRQILCRPTRTHPELVNREAGRGAAEREGERRDQVWDGGV